MSANGWSCFMAEVLLSLLAFSLGLHYTLQLEDSWGLLLCATAGVPAALAYEIWHDEERQHGRRP